MTAKKAEARRSCKLASCDGRAGVGGWCKACREAIAAYRKRARAILAVPKPSPPRVYRVCLEGNQ